MERLNVSLARSLRFGVRALFFGLFVACAGCGGSSDIEKSVPVSGTVTFQGKPLEGYQVTFMPTDGRRPALGVTDAAGKFTLGTNKVGDGAPPGMNKVAFVWVPPSVGAPGQETINDNPATMPKPKLKIPDHYADPEKSGITQDVPSRGISDLKFELK